MCLVVDLSFCFPRTVCLKKAKRYGHTILQSTCFFHVQMVITSCVWLLLSVHIVPWQARILLCVQFSFRYVYVDPLDCGCIFSRFLLNVFLSNLQSSDMTTDIVHEMWLLGGSICNLYYITFL